MPIAVIDKIKQKAGDFKLLDASDINWDIKISSTQLPDNLATDEEVNQAIAKAVAGIDQLHREVISQGGSLPATGKPDTIYMLPSTKPNAKDAYEEYLYVNGKWEKIGTSEVDLTNYITNTQLNSQIQETTQTLKSYADTQKNEAIKQAKVYTDQEKAKYLPLSGGTMTGKITGIVEPTQPADAVNKAYVDATVQGVSPQDMITLKDFKTGNNKGTFMVKEKEVSIAGLNSMAYEDKNQYLSRDRLEWKTF